MQDVSISWIDKEKGLKIFRSFALISDCVQIQEASNIFMDNFQFMIMCFVLTGVISVAQNLSVVELIAVKAHGTEHH